MGVKDIWNILEVAITRQWQAISFKEQTASSVNAASWLPMGMNNTPDRAENVLDGYLHSQLDRPVATNSQYTVVICGVLILSARLHKGPLL